MHSRYEVGIEQYLLTVSVEANLTLEMATTIVLPSAIRYQTELAANVAALIGGRRRGRPVDAAGRLRPDRRPEGRSRRPDGGARASCTSTRGIEEAGLRPRQRAARDGARSGPRPTTLEGLVADDLWSLPTYQEMLYIL